jgi:hypothetical protein
MKKIAISKRHQRAKSWLELLPLDPRDQDIVRAKRLTRPLRPSQRRRGRSPRTA